MGRLSTYFAPETVQEAVRILGEAGEAARVIAGGTDVMVRIRRGMVPPEQTTLLSVHRIEEMAGVEVDGSEVVVGAATTAADLVLDPVVREHIPILSEVADRLASAQIRNVATIGGNLANASPAGDLINPMLLLDATLVLTSTGGERCVAASEFFTGPGQTVRRPDELLTRIRIPVPPPGRVFLFRKAGTRPAMECSVVTVGVAFTPEAGVYRNVRVAFGSLAPVPLRGRTVEAALEGAAIGEEAVHAAAAAVAGDVSPIDDIRGTARYRTVLATEFLRRLLHD